MAVLNVQPKPLNFKAIQWTGDNFEEIEAFCQLTGIRNEPYICNQARNIEDNYNLLGLGADWYGIEPSKYIVYWAGVENYAGDTFEVLGEEDFHSKYQVV